MPDSSYQKTRSWTAWHGDLDQLRRLGAALKEVDLERRAELSDLDSDDGSIESDLSMSVREKIDNYGGPLDVIIEQFDRRTALGVFFTAKIGDKDRINVELAGHTLYPEIKLDVESNDPAFTRSAYARLSDEIERGIPWWGKMSTPLRNSITLILAAACIAIATMLVIPHEKPFKFEHWLVVGGTVFWFGFMGLAISVVRPSPMDWFYPQFEVTGDGVSSTTRRVTTLSLLLLSIPIGVFVNAIS